MKFFIVLAVIGCAAAVPAIVNTGASSVSRSDDGHGNYAFSAEDAHATGGSWRKEKGGPGVQVGSYGLRDADGRQRTVSYVADALGFRASISSNEPGVDPHQPAAATTLNGNAPVVPALAVVGHAAPLAVAGHGAYAAPLAYGGPVAAYGGPIGYAGHGLASSYSVGVQHASVAAPLLTKSYGAPLAVGGYGAPVAAYGGAYGAGYGKGLY